MFRGFFGARAARLRILQRPWRLWRLWLRHVTRFSLASVAAWRQFLQHPWRLWRLRRSRHAAPSSFGAFAAWVTSGSRRGRTTYFMHKIDNDKHNQDVYSTPRVHVMGRGSKPSMSRNLSRLVFVIQSLGCPVLEDANNSRVDARCSNILQIRLIVPLPVSCSPVACCSR